jgi:GTP-binding protein LepA
MLEGKNNFSFPIRNFSIISHIDHGKSTLADRFLELTKTIAPQNLKPQYLDSMSLEREKGITIKMHPVRMKYLYQGREYILNLIDTPGHIDFSYEISRALYCVEGAILLVDATKGVQAQTLFNLEEAKKQNLKIIGAVNKIDLPQARIKETRKELAKILGQKEEEIFLISAKTGENVKELLEFIIEKVPPPKEVPSSGKTTMEGLIFDSKYDPFSGVIAFVRLFQGRVRGGDSIYFAAQKIFSQAKEVGIFSPELRPVEKLEAGEIGYIKTGVKEPGIVKVGDTVVEFSGSNFQLSDVKPLPGYKEPQPVLFLSLYPEDASQFDALKLALEKLKLTDPSLNFQLESKESLGRGFRIGFLGSLQAEIILRRITEEFNLDIVSTSPQVVFKVITKSGEEVEVSSPEKWPDPSAIKETLEPQADVEIITPSTFLNAVFKLLNNYEVAVEKIDSLSSEKVVLRGEAPLRKVITGKFYDDIKSKTQGYASFSFKQSGYKPADLVKLDILIGSKKEDAFSKIVAKKEAYQEGKSILLKLKKFLPPQQFVLKLQAAIGSRVIAAESIRALRKDVTAPLYGGDFTRKKKLLEIQKKGKKKLKERAGKIKIPSRVFLEMIKEK